MNRRQLLSSLLMAPVAAYAAYRAKKSSTLGSASSDAVVVCNGIGLTSGALLSVGDELVCVDDISGNGRHFTVTRVTNG